ncbi:helix-turn-helix transcriptional regulator [Cupriavidus sp. USMAA2-4]|uniref:LuxR C-terminal-related transcriptional regulator n=1 Tax=Cupriavidus sp. USMAA2-4 TaxID=876364 RepID=UPI0008A6F63C|nr:LuxR C-terminal-related transcriptional regulator [Cupriavidus sp. USMAA2-4]AOY96333.1 helix-turn-helix transcriptional regulator [Cupriavidus sp. USMAA2-4]
MPSPVDPSRTPLTSKLSPPTTSVAQVARGEIRERVRAAGAARVVLVRAPAGFGKTTAMVQCRSLLEASGVDTAWLTLDGADNDPSRFLACLAAAVGGMAADAPAAAPAMADAGLRSPADMALAIMAGLAARTAPFAVFLDDFEALQEPAVLRLVREILDGLPRGGRLVIGSRGLPDLGLGRLRARGQLLEIDAALLRFSLPETAELLNRRRDSALPDDEVARLHGKAEGWPAALWLASLALERRDDHRDRDRFIARFSGSNQALADYLAEDVLERQPAPVRDFLLRTAILRHLDAGLCDHLLPGVDSAAMLARLEADNLFLTPMEGDAPSYRYHSLFADFLRAQLQRELPDEGRRLHRAAAHWYEAHGRPVPAIDHALEGGSFDHAVRLLARHAIALLEGGRMRLLTRWFGAIPPACIAGSPLLQVVHVWALCLTHGPHEAQARLDGYGCAADPDPEVRPHVLALQPFLLAVMDQAEEAFALGREALRHMPARQGFAEGVLSNCMAYLSAVMGEYQESHRLLDAARSSPGAAASHFIKMYSESVGGLTDLEEGRLRQATARFRIAVGATHAASQGHTGGNAWAGVLYAASLYEADELDQARHLLQVYLPLARDAGLADHMIQGYMLLSRIAFHHGDVDQAFHCLTELEYLGHQRQLPRVVSSAKLERAHLLTMQGHLQGAREELERANDAALWARVARLRLPAHDLQTHEMAELRWLVAAGRAASALPRLADGIDAAVRSRRFRRALKLRVLQAMALARAGDAPAALAAMTGALRNGCAEGFVRLFADEGGDAALLVRQVEAMTQEEGAGAGADPIFRAYLQRLAQACGGAGPGEAALPPDCPALVEPLTAKEIRLLALVAEGYSNSALAEKLFVSDSTVRTHLRNINGKLNAQNRTQAVAIARRLELIR